MDDRRWDVGLTSSGINSEIVTVGVTVGVVGLVVLVHWVFVIRNASRIANYYLSTIRITIANIERLF